MSEAFPQQQPPLAELHQPFTDLAQPLDTLPPAAGVEHVEITATGAEFQVGNVTYDYLGSSPHGMLFTSVDETGVKRPLIVYKSNSGGSYRVSQGLETYNGKQRLMKGPELSVHSQYTQDTQLHPDFDEKIGYIEESRQLRQLPIRHDIVHSQQDAESLMRDFESQTEVYPLGDLQLNTALYEFRAGALSAPDIAELTDSSASDDPTVIAGRLAQKVTELNSLLEQSGAMPDFSGDPVHMTVSSHPQLGPVVLETFEQPKDGVVYQWQMAHDTHGRVWVERIRFANAEPSAYGTDKQVVYSGVLTSKPLDYANQANGLPASQVHEFGNGYVDISEFLKTLAPISQYAAHYRTRDNLYSVNNQAYAA